MKILSLAIKSAGRSDIVLPVPEGGNPKGLWFTLKERSCYRLVSNTPTVWKTDT